MLQQQDARAALMMEIAAAGDDHKALRKIAAALLAKAAGGDVSAINTLADRTDGKVAQALIGDSEHDSMQVHHTIVRKIVEPDAKQADDARGWGMGIYP